jgi:hypothetical protein
MSAPAKARRSLRPDLEDELMARRREQLARIAYRVRDVPVETDIVSGPPVEALIEDVLRFGHDADDRRQAQPARDEATEQSVPQRHGDVDEQRNVVHRVLISVLADASAVNHY